MALMNEYQLKMNECWNSLRSPVEVKSIMGLVEEYKYINVILDNEKFDNPSMNFALYDSDASNLDLLKSIIFLMRARQLNDIRNLIAQLKEIDFLT
jgi:hypothetical protein